MCACPVKEISDNRLLTLASIIFSSMAMFLGGLAKVCSRITASSDSRTLCGTAELDKYCGFAATICIARRLAAVVKRVLCSVSRLASVSPWAKDKVTTEDSLPN